MRVHTCIAVVDDDEFAVRPDLTRHTALPLCDEMRVSECASKLTVCFSAHECVYALMSLSEEDENSRNGRLSFGSIS